METSKIIVNESYWHLLENRELRTSSFIVPELNALDSISTSVNESTKNLCLLMQKHDINTNSLYGIEIKTNGSSRSGRIPLIRVAVETQSIWKISQNLKSVEKTILDLDKLIYYLNKSRTDENSPLPYKVIFCQFDEKEYTNNGSYSNYVKDLVEKTGVIWISAKFLQEYFVLEKRVDIDSLIQKEKAIFTKEPII